MKYLFGVPFYKYNVKTPQSILNDIQHNYEIDSSRNSWDNKSYLHSKTHHSNRDRGNPKFKEVNYTPIMSEYKKVFDTFMKELDLDCQYKWTIANYTAMKSQQYMRAHDHIGDSDYTCIHYAKFNPKKHSTTTFYNSHQWANSIKYIRPDYYSKLDIQNEKHSYQLPYFQVSVKQDDILITPSCLVHEVPPFESDELRVTIVINLSIK